MQIETLYLAKKTGTYADALAAFGLAHLLYRLTGEYPRVEASASHYLVVLPSGGYESAALNYRGVHQAPGYRYVVLAPDDPDAPLSGSIDYPHERKRLCAWRKMRKDLYKLRKGKLSLEDREQLRQAEPMTNWMLYQDLRVLQAFGSYNGVHAAIRRAEPAAFAQAVEAKLCALAQHRDSASVPTAFQPKGVTAVQALNPTAGKGTNRPKPDGAALSGLPSAYVDWFEEWLRFIGIERAARAINIGDDIKLMVLAPTRLNDAACQIVHDTLIKEQAWTSAKSDLLAALGLARVLVERSGLLGVDDSDAAEFFVGPADTPRDVIAGIYTAYFKSLGSARALTNIGFVGLPGWFPVRPDTAAEWIEILDEHRGALGALDEGKSEEAALLFLYRDFLSASQPGGQSLLPFLGAWAVHVMRARTGGTFVRQFTVGNLRRLITHMNKTYSPILENEGFRAVAAAMRRATVAEQYWNSKGKQQYQIHYGLFADMKRKAQFRDQLLEAIGEFLNEYNAETARQEERAAKAGRTDLRHRPRLTTRQVEDLVRLLDDYKPETVAMLLLAYASARDPREPDANAAPQAGDDPAQFENEDGGDPE